MSPQPAMGSPEPGPGRAPAGTDGPDATGIPPDDLKKFPFLVTECANAKDRDLKYSYLLGIIQEIRAESTEYATDLPEEFTQFTKGAKRLSLNFRFTKGSADLDTKAQRDMDRLVVYLPPRWLGIPGIYFAVAIAFIFVIIVFI